MNTILVVDDEPVVVKFLANFLSHQGLNTLIADNGNEALSLIKQKSPQLVFLDINIPGLKGLDVLKEAKKVNPQLNIVITTGHTEDELEDGAIKNGACAFLRKPFTMDEVKKLLIDFGVIQSS